MERDPATDLPVMEAPRNGVLLYFSKGNGRTELIIKTDPPDDPKAIRRVLTELAYALDGFGQHLRDDPTDTQEESS